jgi:aspartyl-tRNA(Asn)/glutamyl-tRNA(Gln) amidotransferase subunit A
MKAAERVEQFIAKIKKDNPRINAVLHLNNEAVNEAKAIDVNVAKTGKKGRLYGYVIGVKSNINVKGLLCNCASRTLEDYKASYDSTAIEKIKAEDGVIIGMLNMDEFACGSSGESSAYGPCQNPVAFGYIPGGSSSGAAAAVAAGFCDVALGSDTGGSIRNPSSYCGVVGIKPSYGLVSRYGLIDLSMSLDQIGTIAKNVNDAALVLDVIRGKDERDSQSVESEQIKVEKPGKLTVGIVDISGVDAKVKYVCDQAIEKIAGKHGWKVKTVKLGHINLAVAAYYPLVYAEFFSGTRKFDGRRYGKAIEESAGKEVLRRIFGGSEITKAEFAGEYYQKARAVKEIIKEEFNAVFEDVDCVLLPTCPILPWKVGEGSRMSPEEIYASDALTIPANLAEICAVSVPIGKSGEIPIGLQVMCGKGKEGKMLSIAKEFEDLK